MSRMTKDERHEERASALWGNSPGGKIRANALWGGRGKGAAALLAVTVALTLPAASLAGNGHNNDRGSQPKGGVVTSLTSGDATTGAAYVPANLLAEATANPKKKFAVIIQVDSSAKFDSQQGEQQIENEATGDGGRSKHHYSGAIEGGAFTVSGKRLLSLSTYKHVVAITPDLLLTRTSAAEDASMWQASTNVLPLIGQASPQAPTIAIVDSGVDASKAADFGSRVVASVNFSSLTSSPADEEGHGTMVAGIAAGASAFSPGAAPNANIVSLKTADATGQSMTSDVLSAVDWILNHKDTYGIRVANFSMAGDVQTSFRFDPLDRAVEKLWFAGVVVVAAAGNHGVENTAVDMSYAPANDPFVITVGALDQHQTANPADDTAAPWSAYGHTVDGFAKPDVSAPGRYLVMPVPADATIATTLPERVVAPGYMWMSGTSFAAPAVAGAAAQLLALHPDWTPDQVKGALMLSAQFLPEAGFSGGVGEIDAAAAAAVVDPPNPNANLNDYLVADSATGEVAFDQASWSSANWASASWSSANWASASWSSASWSSASWSSANWASASWSSASWSSASWSSASWSAASWSSASWSASLFLP